MKITVEFDSEEEFKARIKNVRGGKNAGGTDDDNAGAIAAGPQGGGAPAPILPNSGGAFGGGAPAFSPPAGGAFPGANTPLVAPEILQLVGRINATIDKVIAGGQPVDQVLNWFRGEVAKAGHDASAATMDQVKQTFLPKLSQPALEGIAKLMNA